MFVIKGESVSKGIAFGKVTFYSNQGRTICKTQIENVEKEIKRFHEARETAIGELQVLYEKSVASVGQENALVFGIHQMLIEDLDFVEPVCQLIREEHVNVEYAVYKISKEQEEILRKQKRADDMKDVSERLLRILSGVKDAEIIEQAESVLVARNMMPSDMMRLDAKKLSGIVLLEGNANSHVAIFAKAMGIPIIIQSSYEWNEIYIGKKAILDGKVGILYIEPSEDVEQELLKKKNAEQREKEQQQAYKNQKTRIHICANVGSIAEAKMAKENGADGIGLVRSEMFCLRENRILEEEKQFEIYKEIVEIMDGKPVVIRTWDFGEDKQLEAFEEESSRGVRWCFAHKELFRKQLRAICRASAYGDVSVMFPMISLVSELREAKHMLNEVQSEMTEQKILYDKQMRIGVMLETPAAMMISEELAKEVDFCSIGTNDLMQYTFGLSRQKAIAKETYEECYPILMDMIRKVVTNVHMEGKTVAVCGALGSDLNMTELFVNMKMDELSVGVETILEIREKVGSVE